jgi:hypothetical protein
MKRLATPRLEALIFVFVFGLSAYFYNGYGWNQTARYDAIWAFVEPGSNRYTFRIDDFVTDPEQGLNTGDFARNPAHSEHYYSNKAPGTSLLGVPAYAFLFHVERFAGFDPVSTRGVLLNAYLINLWVTVIPLALSAVFFYHLALRFARDRHRALLVTIILYAGTLMLPFSTALWGHTTAAAFAVMAVACFVRPGRRAPVWAGLFAGLAALTDYGALPLAVSLVVAAAVASSRRERLPALLLGSMAPLMVFLLYHWALFGSPLALASSYSPETMVDQGRLMGLFGAINLRALYGLTVSASRGLFVYMPVLLLSLYALRFVRQGPDRAFWWLAIANMLAVLLINATFNGWQGGTAAGPRYQIIALPFYGVLLAMLPNSRRVSTALYVLGGISVAHMFVLTATSPIAVGTWMGSELWFAYHKLWSALRIDLGVDPAPLAGSLSAGSIHGYPTFLMRDWTIPLTDPVLGRYAVFNLGERLLGLRGVASLLPAVAGAAGLGVWMSRIARRDQPSA